MESTPCAATATATQPQLQTQINLDQIQQELPLFKVQWKKIIYSFDPLELTYKLRSVMEEKDPSKVRAEVEKCCKFEGITGTMALAIIQQLTIFLEQYEEPLKKVLGPECLSTTATVSIPA